MSKKIQFINFGSSDVLEEYRPVPARSMIPGWYKKQSSYVDDVKEIYVDKNYGFTSASVKKCMPVFDSITAGYLLVTTQDITVFYKNGQRMWRWSNEDATAIDFQSVSQANEMPVVKKHIEETLEVPKFFGSWGIKTPSGYSCMFINPMHKEQDIFNIIEGIVDTDKYWQPISFPFVLLQEDWQGTIPAGTPITQIIPFKRDNWFLKIETKESNPKLYKEVKKKVTLNKSKFWDSYKSFFWSKKSFK